MGEMSDEGGENQSSVNSETGSQHNICIRFLMNQGCRSHLTVFAKANRKGTSHNIKNANLMLKTKYYTSWLMVYSQRLQKAANISFGLFFHMYYD